MYELYYKLVENNAGLTINIQQSENIDKTVNFFIQLFNQIVHKSMNNFIKIYIKWKKYYMRWNNYESDIQI